MNALEDAIYDTLYTGAIATKVSTRIYRVRAPEGATHPLIVYAQQAGGDENMTPNESKSLLYQARGVSEVSADDAGDIDDLIHAALHKVLITVTGYTVYWCAAVSEIRFTETDASGKTYFHAGHIYRVRLD